MAEGVSGNTPFIQGDACCLPFEDETFDAVTGNYCYHNIPSQDRRAILLEMLRVLRKGGTFALHDVMLPRRYGDMQTFAKKLLAMGYKRVELIDTTSGKFMTRKEATLLGLTGSTLLIGEK